MNDLIALLVAFLAGAVAVKASPKVDEIATKLRDWLYGLFRKGPDDSDSAGA